MYDSVMQLTTEATLKSKQEMEEQVVGNKKNNNLLCLEIGQK